MSELRELNPESRIEQMGWKKIEHNVQEAYNAKRVIEVDLGNKSITYYTDNASAQIPEGIRVTLDTENQIEKAA